LTADDSAVARLLIVAHAFPPTVGGVETHLWDLSHQLSRCGHEVYCLVGGTESLEYFDQITVARHPQLTARNLVEQRVNMAESEVNSHLLASLSKIAASTNESFHPDIVHFHNAHHFAPELALAFFQSQRSSAPMINSVHDRVGDKLYPKVLQYDWAHTIFASEYLFRSFPTTAGPASVLRLGINLHSFSTAGDLDSRFAEFERPIIFHPARLLRWKGTAIGLEAFIKLRQQLKSGTLVLCESGGIESQAEVSQLRSELESRSKSAGVADCVHFLDFDRLRMPAAYRASELVWYPTTDEEPFGLVPLEAMASGIPVVVSDSGGMRETGLPEVTGIVVAKDDSQALADAALRLLSNEDLRAKLVDAGRHRSQAFDIRAYTNSLERIYESLRSLHG